MKIIDEIDTIGEDNRQKKYLLPCSVIQTEGDVSGAENCLVAKALQIALCEPELTMLKNSEGQPHASILFDFGREIHGGVRILTASSSKWMPARVRLTFGESIAEAISTLGEKNSGNDHAPRDFEALLPKWSDLELGQTGFRYLRLELLENNATLELKSLVGVFVYREMEYVGSFECRDPLLNKIYDTAAYTVHLNMQNMLWDGIKRDRLVWIGDTHPEYLAIRSLFDDCSIVFDNLRFARDEAILPAWMNGMPAYSFWWLILLRDVSFTEDDYTFVKESKEYIEGLLKLIISKINKDGTHTFGSYFLDWKTDKKPEAVAGVHALIYMALKAGKELCEVLDKNELAGQCQSYCVILQNNIPNAHNCSAAHALLIFAGLCGDIDVIFNNGEYDMSTMMSYYISSALANHGRTQKALDMIRAYYGGMLDMGATTFWEDFDIRWLENASRIDEIPTDEKLCIHSDRGDYCYEGLRNSLCHGWSSGPVAFLSEYILGIRMTEPGGKSIHLCPALCDLDYVKGSYPTKYGKISVEWRKEGDKIALVKLVCPKNIKVTFHSNIIPCKSDTMAL